MAELNFCKTCYALTNPEDAKAHAAEHAHIKARFDALTRQNTNYLQEVAALKQQLVAYGKQLDAHPISMDPETITISAAPEFDDDELDNAYDDIADDQPASTYVDEQVQNTVALDPADYPPPIDRDDLDTVNALGPLA